MNELGNYLIDDLQDKKLKNGIFDGNEKLLNDVVFNFIDNIQDKINNSQDITQEQKDILLGKIFEFLINIEEKGDNISLLKKFNSYLESLNKKETLTEILGIDTIDIAQYDSLGLPIVEGMDEDSALSFKNKKNELKKQFHNGDITEKIYLQKIYSLYEKYSSLSNFKGNPESSLREIYNKISSTELQKIFLYGTKLYQDINNQDKTKQYLDLYGDGKFFNLNNISPDNYKRILIGANFINLSEEEKQKFLLDPNNQKIVEELKMNGLDLDKNTAENLANNKINSVKNKISQTLLSIESVDEKNYITSIYSELIFILDDSQIWGLEEKGLERFSIKLSEDEIIKILKDFHNTILKNNLDPTTKIALMVKRFGTEISSDFANLCNKKISKLACISSVAWYRGYDDIKEISLLASTFLPFGVGNVLDIGYGIASLNNGKSTISGKDISQDESITQIAFGTFGLSLDIVSGGTSGNIGKGILKSINHMKKGTAISHLYNQIVKLIKANIGVIKEMFNKSNSVLDSITNMINFVKSKIINNYGPELQGLLKGIITN